MQTMSTEDRIALTLGREVMGRHIAEFTCDQLRRELAEVKLARAEDNAARESSGAAGGDR